MKNSLGDLYQSFKVSAGFKRYFANTSWLMFENIAAIAVTALVGIFVARYLQPKNFGLLNYATSLVGLFGAFISLGINNILIRELVSQKNKTKTFLGTGWLLKFIGAIFLNLVVFLIATREDSLAKLLILIIGFSNLFKSLEVIELFYYAKVKAKFPVIIHFTQMIISSLLKLLLIFLQAPLIFFALIILIDSIFNALGLMFFYTKHEGSLFKWKINTDVMKHLIKESWPLLLASVMVSVYMKIDQVIIKNMLGVEAVGQYAAAVKLSEMWYFVPMAIVNSVYPALIKAKKMGEGVYKFRFKQLYSMLFLLALFVSIIITLFSKPLINILYGASYLPAAPVLAVHIWASIFVFFGLVSSKWLLIENLQKYSSINTFVGALVNIVLNIVLIPKLGILGSALATTISYAFAVFFLFIVVKRLRKHFYIMIKSVVAPNLNIFREFHEN